MLTELTITAIEPFADGASFGNTAAYERVRGTFKGRSILSTRATR